LSIGRRRGLKGYTSWHTHCNNVFVFSGYKKREA
jgi:hypothetical protein